jgi:hypothetical protein
MKQLPSPATLLSWLCSPLSGELEPASMRAGNVGQARPSAQRHNETLCSQVHAPHNQEPCPAPCLPGDKVVVALADADGVVTVEGILGNAHVAILPPPRTHIDSHICTATSRPGERRKERGQEQRCEKLSGVQVGCRARAEAGQALRPPLSAGAPPIHPLAHPRRWNGPPSW